MTKTEFLAHLNILFIRMKNHSNDYTPKNESLHLSLYTSNAKNTVSNYFIRRNFKKGQILIYMSRYNDLMNNPALHKCRSYAQALQFLIEHLNHERK